MNFAVNVVRSLHGMQVSNITLKPGSGTSAANRPGSTTTLALTGGSETAGCKVTLKVNQDWDQGCRMEVQPVGEDVICAMRKRWLAKNYPPPPPARDLTDNQLSILARLQEGGHKLLAFDMGSGGPSEIGVSALTRSGVTTRPQMEYG